MPSYEVARLSLFFSIIMMAGLVALDAIGVYYSAGTCVKRLGLSFKILLSFDAFEEAVYIFILVPMFVYFTAITSPAKFASAYRNSRVPLFLITLARVAMIIYLGVQTFGTTAGTHTCIGYLWNSGISYFVISIVYTVLGAVPLLMLFDYISATSFVALLT